MEGGEGFVDSGDGAFVRVDVKVANCVVNELTPLVVTIVKPFKTPTYRCGVFVEKHCESRKSGLQPREGVQI